MEKYQIEKDGTYIDCVCFGNGTKPLVLIQGYSLFPMINTARSLEMKFQIFSEDYRIYCIDRKKVIPENYSLSSIAEDYAFVMKAIGLEKADVLSYSQGGMIAQYLVLNHPELVKRIVFVSTLCDKCDCCENLLDIWINFMDKRDGKGLVKSMFTYIDGEEYVKSHELIIPVIGDSLTEEDFIRAKNLLKTCYGIRTKDRLKEIKSPALVIAGKKDQVIPLSACVNMANSISCALKVIENGEHSAFETTEVKQIAYQFLMKK